MSEFSSSIYENLPTMKLYEDKVLARGPVTYLVYKIRPLRNALQRFNNKDSNLPEEPETADLCEVMKTVDDLMFVAMTTELFVAGGTLYHMAVQLMVL